MTTRLEELFDSRTSTIPLDPRETFKWMTKNDIDMLDLLLLCRGFCEAMSGQKVPSLTVAFMVQGFLLGFEYGKGGEETSSSQEPQPTPSDGQSE